MKELFLQYEKLYSRYEDLLSSKDVNFPRYLRTFNIRFRLALDLIVDYKGDLAYVKTEYVKETYILTLKLMDLWNSYEALIRYVSKELGHTLKKIAPDSEKKKVDREAIENYYRKTTALDSLKDLALALKTKATEKETFHNEFEKYIHKINRSKNIDKRLEKQNKDILKFITSDKNISGIEILSLIYSERNLYYHDGEPGKMGISYSNRKYLLGKYHECLIEVILKTICYVLKVQIKEEK